MQKLFFIFAICLTFACKKKNEVNQDFNNSKWSLSTATVKPAIMLNGKAETNYRLVQQNCLRFDVILFFSNDGTYRIDGGGPACDFWNTGDQKYSRIGNEVTLKNGSTTLIYNLVNNELKSTDTIQINNASHTVEYVYIRKTE